MWYVLYTRPRNEKKAAKLLEEKDIEVYCPVSEVVKQWSDRKKKVLEPVFPSYIFVNLDDFDRDHVRVLQTPGAVRFLYWLGKPGIVRDEEVKAIKDFLNDYKGAHITLTMVEGDEVVITQGPLRDRSGTIIKFKGTRAMLQVRSLGWNILAELPLQSIQRKHP